jgi:hypothetical protein
MPSIAERFDALFSGLRRAFGQYLIPQGTKADARGKVEGRASTWSNRDLSIEDWEDHLAAKRGLGICPLRDDDTCLFGAIDIDIYPTDSQAIYEKCREQNIPLILCRTKSGGIHGYLFLSEPVSAKLVRQRLATWAATVGYEGIEIFPAQDTMDDKATGNWINCAYFGDELSLRYAYAPDGTGALTSEQFLDLAESTRVSLEWLKEWHPVALSPPTPLSDWHEAPPCLIHLAENDGYHAGRRNNAIFNVGIYVRKRHEDGWRDVLKDYNQRYFNPPLRDDELRQTMNSLAGRAYKYTCKKPPIVNCCNERVCLTRKFGVGYGLATDPGESTGTKFGDLLKIESEPPIWRLTVNDRVVDLSSAEFLNQGQFCLRVLDVINVVIDAVSPTQWKAFMRERLETLTIKSVSEESTLRGEVGTHLATFCGTKAQAKALDEILSGRPWTNGGRVSFIPTYFFEHLHARKVAYTRQRLAVIMGDLGMEEHKEIIKGKAVSYWSVPEPSVQTEPFDVPTLPKEEPF